MKRSFVIITTRLPPAMCGVGTYSALLRKHWPNDETPVHFLVVGEAAAADPIGFGDTVTEFGDSPARLQEALRKIGTADVLLHYAGRAYHRYGCPTWMPGALARWKREFPESRLTIFFHELSGPMPATSRHYWLGKINERIVRKLASLADTVATNTENHRAQLHRIARRDDILLLPVASNIEAPQAETSARAEDEFVVFGMSFGRLQTLRAFAPYIQKWSDTGRLRKLHMIGPDDDKFSAEADAVIAAMTSPAIIERHGMLPSSDVSRLLARARFALTNVTPETWSKSGAFMACAAHRCAVVHAGAAHDSLPLSYTVTAHAVATVSPEELDRKTTLLAQWYRDNAAWPVIAQKLAATSHPDA